MPPLTAVTFLVAPSPGALVTTVGAPRTAETSRLFPDESNQTLFSAS